MAKFAVYQIKNKPEAINVTGLISYEINNIAILRKNKWYIVFASNEEEAIQKAIDKNYKFFDEVDYVPILLEIIKNKTLES